MALVRRGASGGGGQGDGFQFQPSDEDQDSWPLLMEFLVSERWPDGSDRTTGSLLVFLDQGKLKACLNDRDAGLVCFVAADTMLDLLAAADKAIGPGTGDWRASKAKGRGRP